MTKEQKKQLSTTLTSTARKVNLSKSSALPAKLLRIGIHFVGILPLLTLLFRWQTNQLTVNPIQFIEQSLGLAAINLLVVDLAITPLVTITGWKQPGRHKRALGLYAFFYALIHFLTFSVVDYGADLPALLRQTLEKPFIIVGSLALLILLAMAVTSFKYWKKKLGKNWKRLHRTVYVASLLIVVHYAWALKGSVGSLSGDVIRPLLYGGFIIILLVLRIPAIKTLLINIRKSWRTN